ncbi:MAG: hypothetical protein K0S34_1547 [Bacillales bacterium]|jgi:uncharacterized membrane protein|nr:hypothetical protein [Bacillales bacterium]
MRPIIKIKKTMFEVILNTISIASFICILIYLKLSWSDIPETVPMHFDSTGKVDNYGAKEFIFILPMVGAILWIMLTILEKFPHTYNYINLTSENIEKQYKNGSMMINILKNEISIFFTYLTWNTVNIAISKNVSLNNYFLLIFLTTIFGSIAVFFIRSIRLK